MGREYDDGVPIRSRPRPSETNPPAIVLGLLFVAFAWGGLLLATFAAVDIGGGTGGMFPLVALASAAVLWLVGTAGGCLGWAALGSRPGVAAFRVAAVSGFLCVFLAAPFTFAGCRAGDLYQQSLPAPTTAAAGDWKPGWQTDPEPPRQERRGQR